MALFNGATALVYLRHRPSWLDPLRWIETWEANTAKLLANGTLRGFGPLIRMPPGYDGTFTNKAAWRVLNAREVHRG